MNKQMFAMKAMDVLRREPGGLRMYQAMRFLDRILAGISTIRIQRAADGACRPRAAAERSGRPSPQLGDPCGWLIDGSGGSRHC
jgi:hypothetical protein